MNIDKISDNFVKISIAIFLLSMSWVFLYESKNFMGGIMPQLLKMDARLDKFNERLNKKDYEISLALSMLRAVPDMCLHYSRKDK